MTDSATIHGTSVSIDGKGVLITGEAGFGKTTLALELIRRSRAARVAAGLIADDRTALIQAADGLVLGCPAPLSGKIELRGFGIADATDIAVAQAELALLVDLVAPDKAVRFADENTALIAGQAIARLDLPRGPAPSAAGAIFAALGQPLWL